MHLDGKKLEKLEQTKNGILYDCILHAKPIIRGVAWIDPENPDGIFFKAEDLDQAGKVSKSQYGHKFEAMDFSRGIPRKVSRRLSVLEKESGGWLYLA